MRVTATCDDCGLWLDLPLAPTDPLMGRVSLKTWCNCAPRRVGMIASISYGVGGAPSITVRGKGRVVVSK